MAGNSDLDAYQGFEEVKVLVDIGGGSASTLSHTIARHPHIKGINFGEPHIIEACPGIPGVDHVGGDFRKSALAGADAIFMKWTLHNWDDKTCLRILKICFKALPAHGKVIVADSILLDRGVFDDGDRLAFQFNVAILVLSRQCARANRVRGAEVGFGGRIPKAQRHLQSRLPQYYRVTQNLFSFGFTSANRGLSFGDPIQ